VAQGKAQPAIEAYSEALKIEPRTTPALIRRGLVQEGLKHTAEAEKDYRAALAVDPENPLAANNLAFLLAEQKRSLNEALALAKKAVSVLPHNQDFLDTLAWVYRARDERGEAVNVLQPLADSSKNAGLLFHLGIIYSEMGKKPEAISAFDKALKIDPSYQAARVARSKLTGS
jgi:tetratricopeptide (TPR) repeat protein